MRVSLGRSEARSAAPAVCCDGAVSFRHRPCLRAWARRARATARATRRFLRLARCPQAVLPLHRRRARDGGLLRYKSATFLEELPSAARSNAAISVTRVATAASRTPGLRGEPRGRGCETRCTPAWPFDHL